MSIVYSKSGSQSLRIEKGNCILYIPVINCPNFSKWLNDYAGVTVSEVSHLINFEPQ